jgi:hypothetical protein
VESERYVASGPVRSMLAGAAAVLTDAPRHVDSAPTVTIAVNTERSISETNITLSVPFFRMCALKFAISFVVYHLLSVCCTMSAENRDECAV